MNLIFAIVFLSFPLKDITTLNKETINLDTIYTKKPVYVSFWALWCSQCIKELDRINKLMDSLDFFVVAVNEDGKRKMSRVGSFVKGHKWNFPVIIDKRQKLMREFGVMALPSSFLYDTEGNLVKRFTGFSSRDEKVFLSILDSLKSNVDTVPVSSD